jgi:hypothetical protein
MPHRYFRCYGCGTEGVTISVVALDDEYNHQCETCGHETREIPSFSFEDGSEVCKKHSLNANQMPANSLVREYPSRDDVNEGFIRFYTVLPIDNTLCLARIATMRALEEYAPHVIREVSAIS